MSVPFIDLRGQYLQLKDEIQPALEDIMSRGGFILGQEVSDFESDFAAYSDCSEGVGVASGLDALKIALRALDSSLDGVRARSDHCCEYVYCHDSCGFIDRSDSGIG